MPRAEKIAASIFNINLRTETVALVVVIIFAAAIVAGPSAQAQTFQVLHAFTDQQDGASPGAGA